MLFFVERCLKLGSTLEKYFSSTRSILGWLGRSFCCPFLLESEGDGFDIWVVFQGTEMISHMNVSYLEARQVRWGYLPEKSFTHHPANARQCTAFAILAQSRSLHEFYTFEGELVYKSHRADYNSRDKDHDPAWTQQNILSLPKPNLRLAAFCIDQTGLTLQQQRENENDCLRSLKWSFAELIAGDAVVVLLSLKLAVINQIVVSEAENRWALLSCKIHDCAEIQNRRQVMSNRLLSLHDKFPRMRYIQGDRWKVKVVPHANNAGKL